MGNVDKEDREIPNIPSIHLVSTLKDVKDFFFGIQFSADGWEHILNYGRGMCT